MTVYFVESGSIWPKELSMKALSVEHFVQTRVNKKSA